MQRMKHRPPAVSVSPRGVSFQRMPSLAVLDVPDPPCIPLPVTRAGKSGNGNEDAKSIF